MELWNIRKAITTASTDNRLMHASNKSDLVFPRFHVLCAINPTCTIVMIRARIVMYDQMRKYVCKYVPKIVKIWTKNMDYKIRFWNDFGSCFIRIYKID